MKSFFRKTTFNSDKNRNHGSEYYDPQAKHTKNCGDFLRVSEIETMGMSKMTCQSNL